MTPEQVHALKCAYADLQGIVEMSEQGEVPRFEIDSIILSISELEEAFGFLTEEPAIKMNDDGEADSNDTYDVTADTLKGLGIGPEDYDETR